MRCKYAPVGHRGTYIVDADDLGGWSSETLADALRGPLIDLGVIVECESRTSGQNKGLTLDPGISALEADLLAIEVEEIVERIVMWGK